MGRYDFMRLDTTNDIVVLTPQGRSRDRLLDASVKEGPRLTDASPSPPGQVYCTTVYDFKGLESTVVILADIRRWPPEWEDMVRLLYVGCSRACNYLILLVDENASPRLWRAFGVKREQK